MTIRECYILLHLTPHPRCVRTMGKGKMAKILHIAAMVGFLSLGMLQSCSRTQSQDTALAEVGSAKLTLEEIRQSFPSEFEHLIKREQYLDFVKRWIEDEVVYQEALKNKLDKDTTVQRKIERMKRKILIEEYFSAFNASESYEPDDVTLSQYYEMNKEHYRRKQAAVKFMHIRLEDPTLARQLRRQAAGDNFLAVASRHSADPVPESPASLPFKTESEIPACLVEPLFSLRPNQNSAPVECQDGVYFLRVLEKAEVGDIIPFEEARNDISSTLVMNRREKMLQNRVAELKQNASITLNVDRVPGSTSEAEMDPVSEDPIEPETHTHLEETPPKAKIVRTPEPKSVATPEPEKQVQPVTKPAPPPRPKPPAPKPAPVASESIPSPHRDPEPVSASKPEPKPESTAQENPLPPNPETTE